MFLKPYVFALIQIRAWADPIHNRQDSDGELLAKYLQLGKEATEIVEDSSAQFILMLSDHISGSSVSLADLNHAAVHGTTKKCGICFAFIAAGLSMSFHDVPENELRSILATTPSGIPADSIADPITQLYIISMSLGSTFGLLGTLTSLNANKVVISHETCIEIANIAASFAKESASVDVFSSFIPPFPLEPSTTSVPRTRLSPEVFNEDSDNLSYYIRIMKDNAHALSAAFMLGAGDFVDMLGVEEDIDPEEIMRSIEQLNILDDASIAHDLLATINSVRHNQYVMMFNEGLGLYEKSEEDCLAGLELHHRVIVSQSIFVKVLFHTMVEKYFVIHNKANAIFLSLILSEMGSRPSMLNTMALLEHDQEFSIRLSDRPKRVFEYMDSGDRRGSCSNTPDTVLSNLSLSACAEECMSAFECIAVGSDEDGSCRLYSECDMQETDTDELGPYLLTKVGRIQNACWPPSKACVIDMHYIIATLFKDTVSMNYLHHYYMDVGDFHSASFWATESASHSDPEGVFSAGMLELTIWEDHDMDVEQASAYFDKLYEGISALINEEANDESSRTYTSFHRMEIEAARDIAVQIGLHDIDVPDERTISHPRWVQRIAAVVGYSRIALIQYSYWLPRIVSLVALTPMLLVLLFRRTYLV